MIACRLISHAPEDLRLPRFLFLLLALICGISELRLLFTMVETILHLSVMHGRFGDFDRMHETFRVRADVRLHAEVLLVAFLRLVHLGVTLLVLVLCARRSGDDRGIGDRAMPHGDSFPFQNAVHDDQKLLLQFVFLQKMTEVQNRRLIGDTVSEKIDLQKLLEGVAIVDGLFHSRITQVIPLLQEVDLEHHLQFFVLSSELLLDVERRDGVEHFIPRHDLLHLIEKLLAPEFLLVGN